MLNLYNKNGLVFWTEEDIQLREHMCASLFLHLKNHLMTLNRAFEFIRIEAPILTPH